MLAMFSIVHLVAAVYMLGVIWFVQIVHYPLMHWVPTSAFRDYALLHQRRTGYVVLGPMLIELISAATLLGWAPAAASHVLLATNLASVLLLWGATLIVQMPLHRRLATGYDRRVVQRLIGTNWLRTVVWSLRLPLAGWLAAKGTI